ncbi:four helix bundle protein [Oceanithermus sp.]
MEVTMGPRNLKELEVWREAIALAKRVHETSKDWPKEEVYGLTSQTRRAATSIASNLAEGLGRGSSAEIVRFGKISLGSAYELYSLLELSSALDYSTPEDLADLSERLNSLTRRIAAYINHWKGQK